MYRWGRRADGGKASGQHETEGGSDTVAELEGPQSENFRIFQLANKRRPERRGGCYDNHVIVTVPSSTSSLDQDPSWEIDGIG